MKVCINCLEKVKESKDICPKCRGSNIKEIDELMLPIFKILQLKGYNPAICYSGHIYTNYGSETTNDTVVVLNKGVKIEKIPKNFEILDDKNFIIIKKKDNSETKNVEDIFEEICNYENDKQLIVETIKERNQIIIKDSLELLEWADSLKDIN